MMKKKTKRKLLFLIIIIIIVVAVLFLYPKKQDTNNKLLGIWTTDGVTKYKFNDDYTGELLEECATISPKKLLGAFFVRVERFCKWVSQCPARSASCALASCFRAALPAAHHVLERVAYTAPCPQRIICSNELLPCRLAPPA